MKWYKVTVKFTEQQEDSTFKRVQKVYLIQAESFSDAEMSTYENLKGVMRQGGEVVGMSRVNVHKIIEGESDTFFELKIQFTQADDAGKKEKKVTHNIFMRADSAEEAVAGLRKTIKKDYPFFNLVGFKVSDIQHAYPVNDGVTPIKYSAEVDDEDEDATADATAEVSDDDGDFELPTKTEAVEETAEAPAEEPAAEEKPAKTKAPAKVKAGAKKPAAKATEPATEEEDDFALPKK